MADIEAFEDALTETFGGQTDETTDDDNKDESPVENEKTPKENEEGDGDKDDDRPDDDDGKPKKNRLSKRFKTLTSRNRDLAQKIEKYEKTYGPLEGENGLPPKPNPAHYRSEKEYEHACIAWNINAKNVQQQREKEKQEKIKSDRQNFQKRIANEKSNYKDFDKVVQNFVEMMGDEPLTPELHETLCDDPNGVDMLYLFGKHPDIAEEILALPPRKQAIELGRLSEKISIFNRKNKREKSVSKAPKPPSKLKSNSKADKDPDKMSMKDYVAYRQKTRTRR